MDGIIFKLKDVYASISFFLGVTIILEIFKFNIGGLSFYLTDVFLILFFILTLFLICNFRFKLCIKDKKLRRILFLFFLIQILSLNFISPVFDYNLSLSILNGTDNSIKYVLKSIVSLSIFFLMAFISSEYQVVFVKQFTKGFVVAIILHTLYSIYQMFSWYFTGVDIHTNLFGLFGITEESVGHVLVNFIVYPIIRSSGLHWDPAYFGLWGGIGLFLIPYIKSKKLRITCFFLLLSVWFLSFSRTGYVAVLIVLFFILYMKKYNESFAVVNVAQIFRFAIFMCVLFVCVLPVLLPEETKKDFEIAISYRFQHNENDEGSVRHIMYPFYSIEAVIQDPCHFFWGYGARNSSRGIYQSGNLKDFTGDTVFDIESDWCKMLVNYGVICFMCFLFFHFFLLKYMILHLDFKSSYYSMFYFVSILSIFIAGITYSYNDSKWVWFVYWVSILYFINKNKIEDNNA